MSNPSLDPDLMLARARRGLTPSEDDTARVRGSLAAALVSGPSGSSPTDRAVSSAPAARRLGAAALAKLGAVVALAATTGAGGYALGFRAGLAERARQAAPIAATVVLSPQAGQPAPLEIPALATPTGNTGAAPRPAHAMSPVAAATPSASVAAGSSGESPLEVETRLLSRVERSLRDKNPRLALGLLGELDREVPGGQLAEERQAARVMAHCVLGSDAAPRLASEFRSSHAGSAYLSRIDQACSTAEHAPTRNE